MRGSYEKFGLSSSRHQAPPSVSRPLKDADFESAIVSLEQSTAAIEEQCRLLEAQKQALAEFRTHNERKTPAEPATVDQRTKLTREKARLEFDVSEMSDFLQSQLQASAKQADVAVAGMTSGIDRMLEKDDRLLDGLQKLFPRIADTGSNGNEARDVERLCQTLTVLLAQDIRTRIDTAYKAAAQDGANDMSDKQRRQRDGLAAELEELAADVDSLASMAVDSRYRTPLSRDLAASKSDAENEKYKWAEYVTSTLIYLTARLEALSDHCQQLHAHQRAVQHVSATLQAMQAAANKRNKHSRTESTKSNVKGLKPLRLVQANLSESQDPAAALLRHLDIRSADLSDQNRLAEVLEDAQQQAQVRFDEQSERTERAISHNLGQSLNKADASLRALTSRLFSNVAADGTVELVDPAIKIDLDALEQTTDLLSEKMRQIDLETIIQDVKIGQRRILQDS